MLYGGIAIGALALVAILAMTGIINLTPARVRNVAGTSLLVITVVFFLQLFLDRGYSREERGRLFVIFAFFLCAAIFWSVFEQAGSTLNFFADRNTRIELPCYGPFPSSWFQSLNALFIIIFAPVFAWLWVKLGHRQPASPVKFAIGLVGVGLGFLIMVPASKLAADGTLVSPGWLTSVYLVHTFAELCLSPVGLSSMTTRAAARRRIVMGVWFLARRSAFIATASSRRSSNLFPKEQLFGRVSCCRSSPAW
jgi:POT family proton-dependent oligopeptide transporter